MILILIKYIYRRQRPRFRGQEEQNRSSGRSEKKLQEIQNIQNIQDGQDGQDKQDGQDGQDGKDGQDLKDIHEKLKLQTSIFNKELMNRGSLRFDDQVCFCKFFFEIKKYFVNKFILRRKFVLIWFLYSICNCYCQRE